MLKHSYNRIRHTSDPVSSPTLRFRMLTVPTYHPELPTPHPSKIITDDAAGITYLTHSFYYYFNSVQGYIIGQPKFLEDFGVKLHH